MKKLAIAMMLGIAAMSASAQVNYKMQVACSPQDVKTYDTNRLRSSFLMEKVMVPNEINVTYSMYDRLIFGGAVPATKELVESDFQEQRFQQSCQILHQLGYCPQRIQDSIDYYRRT